MNIKFDNKQHKSVSFGALKSVKCKGFFNPKKHKEDFAAYYSLFLSDSFKFLFEKKDVYVTFDKFKYPNENKIYSIMHYDVHPLMAKENAFKRMINKITNLILPNPKVKRYWLEGFRDNDSGEKVSLSEKILSVSKAHVNKIIKD